MSFDITACCGPLAIVVVRNIAESIFGRIGKGHRSATGSWREVNVPRKVGAHT